MHGFCDQLDSKIISEDLSDYLCKPEVHILDTIDSTNNYARKLILEGEKTGLVVANHQTAGKGRTGHDFYSPQDTGIYMSYFFTPGYGLELASSVTTRTAVSVATVLENLFHESFMIKWVNDIYLGSRKICGILTEAVTSGINVGSIIVGIGINVTTATFPDEIKDSAGSLPASMISRNEIISGIMKSLIPALNVPADNKEYVSDYRSRLMMVGENVSFVENGVTKYGTVLGVDDECGLLVASDTGEVRTIRNGEVSTLRTSP